MNKITLIACAGLFMSACHTNKPVDLADNKEAKPMYETVHVEKTAISSAIKLPGQLKPYEKVDIYPRMNGFVKEMYVDRGSIVHKGQILMTLEAPEIAQQMVAAQGRLLQARESINASRDRYFRLLSASKIAGSISPLDLTSAQSKYQSDSAMVISELADLTAAQQLQDYLTVRAPFNGVITERNIHPGAITGPSFKLDNKPLLILENTNPLRLETFIPEVYSGSIDTGNVKISFTTDALPGQDFSAPISRASHSLSDDYRSEAIEADIANPKDVFKPGMYVEVSIKIKSPITALLVPSSSIVTTAEGKYVVSVQNNITKFITVKEGIKNKGKTEVFGDLNGEEVILKNPSAETKEGVTMN